MSESIQEQLANMNKSAAELVEDLGWTKKEPRSAYDAAVLRVLEALVSELDALRERIR